MVKYLLTVCTYNKTVSLYNTFGHINPQYMAYVVSLTFYLIQDSNTYML